MKSVSCCCRSLAGKFASRRKTRVAVPSFPVSSSSGMRELVVRHRGHVDARAYDVAAAGAADTHLQREGLRPLVDRSGQHVERLDLEPRGRCDVERSEPASCSCRPDSRSVWPTSRPCPPRPRPPASARRRQRSRDVVRSRRAATVDAKETVPWCPPQLLVRRRVLFAARRASPSDLV